MIALRSLFRTTILLTCGTTAIAMAQEPAANKPAPRPAPAELIESAIREELKLPAAPLPKPDPVSEESPGEPAQTSSPRITLPQLPEGKGRLPAVEAFAQQMRTADAALQVYEEFIATAATSEEKAAVESQRAQWKRLADEGLVRVGKRWMPPEEEQDLKSKADALVAQATERVKKRAFPSAGESLDKALGIYPEHLEALFLQGIVAYLTDELAVAERKFAACLSQRPESPVVLNNLGTCAILLKKPAVAIRHWSKAAEVDPTNKEVAQNLGTLLDDIQSRKFSNLSRPLIDQASAAYAQMLARQAPRADLTRGYQASRTLSPDSP